jgi:hypothetical protein
MVLECANSNTKKINGDADNMTKNHNILHAIETKTSASKNNGE